MTTVSILGSVVVSARLRRRSRIIAGGFLSLLIVAALFAPLLRLPSPTDQSLADRLKPPLSHSLKALHWLGTDHLGRDLFSRVVWGSRASITVAVPAVVLAAAAGLTAGIIGGYRGGAFDVAVMRIADVQLAFPFLLLAMLLVTVLGRGISTLIAAFAVSEWPLFARTSRSQALVVRNLPFVEAARATGALDWWILLRHVLPNASSNTLALATLTVAKVMVAEASLSFLGLGVPPPAPSWGSIISDGRGYVATAWWISAFPGVVLLSAVLAINRIGDDVRESLDPLLRRSAS